MSTARADKLVGRTVGEFVLHERIGEGGFGAVYRASQPALEREAVIKVLHPRLSTAKAATDRFLREAKLASKLDHPYAAHVYAFGAEPDGELWIAMELVRGTPLDQILSIQGPIPLERFVPLLDRICEVVHTAHEQGIVHRDLKPANVMVLSRAGRLLPKLLDFGIAKGLSQVSVDLALDATSPIDSDAVGIGQTQPIAIEPGLTQRGAVMGSPPYMAPEQWMDAARVDARTDLYALGVLAYEALTGTKPFTGSTVTEIATAHAMNPPPSLGARFPAALDKVLATVLAKEPDDRYRDALAFARAFRQGAGIGDEPASLPHLDPAWRDAALNRAPQPIAEAVAMLEAARNAHQARDAVVQLARTLVRYLGVLAIACRSKVSAGADPHGVGELLRALHRRALADAEWIALVRGLTAAWIDRRDAYPVPELVDSFQSAELVDDLSALLAIAAEVWSDDRIVAELASQLARVGRVLDTLAFLADYTLVVAVAGNVAENWMGVRRTQRTSTFVRGKQLPAGEPALLDKEGVPVLTPAPLIQVAAPTPGAPLDLFVFDGRGARGARLVAYPSGFEHHDDGVWDWFRAQLSGSLDDTEATSSEERAPYRGLSSFSSEDASTFFGREKLVDAFVNRLRVQPLLAVVGRSGAGKSSFVQAGVIPALPSGWRTLTMRPGPSPIGALMARLSQAGIATSDLRTRIASERDALGDVLRADAAVRGNGIVLVVDQLEELFTLCDDAEERRAFAEAVGAAARDPAEPVRVIFTLRDDFLLRTEQIAALRNRIGHGLQLLSVPVADDLLRILIEPARRVGYEFEDANLPAEMVAEVADQPGALALLSFAASKLWELRDRHFKQLTRKAYATLGGVGGALARHAELTLEQMPPEERALTQRAFRHLVTTQNTREVLERKELRQLLGGRDHADTVIEKLVTARLLVASENESGAETIEIIHEALLAAWPRLVEWRRDDAAGARFREQLREAARQWHERGRPDGLLWRGDALADYTRWRASHDDPLPDVEAAFAGASIADATRGRRIRRGLAAVTIVALVTGLVVFATLRTRAERERDRAAVAQRHAEYEVRQSLFETGRQLFLDGDPIRAATYLAAAKTAGADGPSIRYLLDRTLGILDKRRLAVESHRGRVLSVLYDRDGKRYVTTGGDGLVRAWDAAKGQLLATFDGHAAGSNVTRAELSPTEPRLLTASSDKTARIWDVDTGRVVQTLPHAEWVWSARYSVDGALVATASWDRTVRIWDATTGAPLATLNHDTRLWDATFSRDGQLVFAAGERDLVRWDHRAGQQRVLGTHAARIEMLALRGDGNVLASASRDSIVKLWDVASGALLHELDPRTKLLADGLPRPQFSPDGKHLLAAAGDQAIVWDVASGKAIHVLRGHRGEVMAVAYDAAGSRLATASSDGDVRIWDHASGQLLALIPSIEPIQSIAFAPNGGELVLAKPSIVETWSTRNDLLVRTFAGLADAYMVALHPAGTRIAACGTDGAIREWELASGRTTMEGLHPAWCSVAYAADGRIVTGADDGLVVIWAAGNRFDELRVAGAQVNAIAPHPTERRVIAGYNTGQVMIWDLESRANQPLVGHDKPVYFTIWHADGRQIATCGFERLARLWPGDGSSTGLALEDVCRGVAFAANGQKLVTAENKLGRIWNLADRTNPALLIGHQKDINYVLGRGADHVITVSSDRTARLWDASTGELLDVLVHPAAVNGADVGRDPSLLATTSGEHVYLWRFPSPLDAARASELVASLPFTIRNGVLVRK